MLQNANKKCILMVSYCHQNIFIEKACDDTRPWTNNAGGNCGYYANEVCHHNGSAISGMENLLGKIYNYPENNCCSCRKHG